MDSKVPFRHDSSLRIAMHIAIIFLVLGIFPVWPYDYYILLRWIVSGTALYILFKLSGKTEIKSIGFILIAILYNPLIPIYLNRPIWTFFDVLIICYYFHEMGALHLFWKLLESVPNLERANLQKARRAESNFSMKLKNFLWWAGFVTLSLFALFILNYVLTYESVKTVAISENEVRKFVPKNYDLAGYHLEDLDGDAVPEALLFFREHRLYNSNPIKESEGFLTLPVRMTVLKFDVIWWTSGWSGILDESQYPSTFFSDVHFSEHPYYKIYSMPNEKILAIFHHSSSFDGLVFKVSFFRYDKAYGLNMVGIESPESYSGILDHNNVLYFTRCNPFIEQQIMDVNRLTLTDGFPSRTLTYDLNLPCNEYYDEVAKYRTDNMSAYQRATSSVVKDLLTRYGGL